MNETVWKFTASSGDAYVPSLHDRTAEKMELEGGELRLFFPGGFVLYPGDPQNPYDEPHDTGPSQVVFSLPDESVDSIRLEVFHDHYLHPIRLFDRLGVRGPLFVTCVRPGVPELIEKINAGKWQLEFVCGYTNPDLGIMFACTLHTNRTSHNCCFTVDCRRIRYCWNEVLPEKAW